MNLFRRSAVLFSLLGCVLALPAAEKDLQVVDLDGTKHQPLQTEESKATVLLFVWHTCPVANSYSPEIERIYQEYKKHDVAFYLVQTDPDLKLERAKLHAEEYAYTLPVLIDRQHELVKHVGAKMTPEAAVLLPDGKLIYRGRIDDRQAALGRRRPQASVHDLRDTLDAILAGERLEPRTTKAVGCYIPETD